MHNDPGVFTPERLEELSGKVEIDTRARTGKSTAELFAEYISDTSGMRSTTCAATASTEPAISIVQKELQSFLARKTRTPPRRGSAADDEPVSLPDLRGLLFLHVRHQRRLPDHLRAPDHPALPQRRQGEIHPARDLHGLKS